ncbi:hypothetical protein ACFFIF_08015 [Vagococcus entomophilus]|uniref:Uncharacterized protein n=1 Tax=Vagococcus entomophilus TaxID=1160095 RepID=A0A430AHA4_9ENTE|nr:hypothetical protein [Vagococcus entomophilus]RSU07291.1 hypothetical protein CBF30_08550 [Vagococcus entomophilus]
MKARFNFMTRPGYKKVIQDYQNGVKSIISKNKMSVKDEVIDEEVKEIINNTHSSMQQFVKSERKRINKDMATLRSSYKRSKSVYSNPQEEILRRQDFDLELYTMSDNDIERFLSDKERTPSEYELRKIASRNNLSSEIQVRVTKKLNILKRPYEQDGHYQELSKALQEIELIDKPLSRDLMMYFPKGDNQVSNVSLRSLNLIQNKPHELGKEAERVNEALNFLSEVETGEIPVKERTQLSSVVEKENKLKYDDFDLRAIRGTKEFDIRDRFTYLKERYNDKSSDRFDIMKDDYNIEEHLNYLEQQHDKRMANDSAFKEQYEAASNKETEE